MTPAPHDTHNVDQVFSELKNFQRASADYIVQRMYLDNKPAQRFLLADEVGLGKTHVARGVIVKAIDLLKQRGVKRIDVIYICSNADIARQNITKLQVPGLEDCALPSRLTLLPKILSDITQRDVNFISFTPGTSFDLKSNTGRADERILLYWMLRGPWRLKNGTGPKNVFQCGTDKDNFRKQLEQFKTAGYLRTIDAALRRAFLNRLKAKPTLRRRFKRLVRQFHYARHPTTIPLEQRQERNAVIGELRRVLAGTCIKALEPDLVILDEFQRFKHLLGAEDPASELARELFEFEDVRVLLMSATPYKMYTAGNESDTDDHYADFMRTVRFLVDDDVESEGFEKRVSDYRQSLYAISGDQPNNELRARKSQLEVALRRIMVRTERLAVSNDRNGMLEEKPAAHLRLHASDLTSYMATQRVAKQVEAGDILDYWKSAPYLLNFMDDYQFKRRFQEIVKSRKRRALADTLSENREMLLPWRQIRAYRAVAPRNARLRDLLATTVDSGACPLRKLNWSS